MSPRAARIDVAGVKASVDIAEVIARYLGEPRGSGRNRQWCCPFHADTNPSLRLTPDGGAFICWSCGAKGDALAFVSRIENLGFIEAAGLLAHGNYNPVARPDIEAARTKDEDEKRERIDAARNLCGEARPIAGTMGARYLHEMRCIDIALSSSLLFHPEVPHSIIHLIKPQRRVRYLPAIVAEIRNGNGNLSGVHIVYLMMAKGRAVKANVDPVKTSLGVCRGGAIRLGEPDDSLAICEGIEDGLSVSQLAGVPVWSVAGTSFLSLIVLPPSVSDLHIYGQNDDPGRKAAAKAAEAHTTPGRKITIHYPPTSFKDWNEFLALRAGI